MCQGNKIPLTLPLHDYHQRKGASPVLTVCPEVLSFSLLYSYFMAICSIVKTIILRCRGRPDALLQEAECRVQ